MVKMVRTATLLPLIAPYVPTCPAFVAEQAIRMAAITLAERSRAWRHVVNTEIFLGYSTVLTADVEGQQVGLVFLSGGGEFVATEGVETTIDLNDMTHSVAVIHEIEFASFNGAPLTPVQFSTGCGETMGRPRYVTQSAPNEISIIPFEAGRLEISLFLKPASAVQVGTVAADPMFDRFNVIPDFFVSLHGNALAAGALSRIFSIADEPWTNPVEGLRYGNLFDRALDASFRGNMRGQQRAKIHTKFRDF